MASPAASADHTVAADPAVTRLVLTEFRNYQSLALNVAAQSVVLTGANGAGKTNVLEAISLLAPGRGLRRAKLADFARSQSAGDASALSGTARWAVAAELTKGIDTVRIGTGVEASQADEVGSEPSTERRVVRIDGQSARGPAALAEIAAVRWLTPQMDRLFVDGASHRRRFLDQITGGYDTNHAARISAYDRTLRQRSVLLRESHGNPDRTWLSALEETIAELGVAIAAARRDVVARLSAALADGGEVHPGAHLAVQGDVEGWLDGQPALAAEGKFRDALEAGRDQDAITGGAATGTHRSDLAVWQTAKDMPAHQCSTGEQKAILIAIVLADVRLLATTTGLAPVVLLDEVAAHLDEDRRDVLYDLVLGLGAQIWATGTDVKMFRGLEDRAQFLTVAAGTIT
ncbi:MAG: DNA replication/repair protein RecF [Alphaproteobacteria bacterium]|nr:DNA replication/repair protein RecF [Alphaproteobacteria bacterium]